MINFGHVFVYENIFANCVCLYSKMFESFSCFHNNLYQRSKSQ